MSVAEIKFGDNDHLAAMVTNLLRAPLLVLLTNVDGLYSDDPRTNPDAELLATVPNIDASVTKFAAETKSALGTGGMESKLKAARLVTASGEAVIMANGSIDGILDRVFASEPVGTLFLPHGQEVPSRKRWFGFTVRPKGIFRLDAGRTAGRARREKPSPDWSYGGRRGIRQGRCRLDPRPGRRGDRPWAEQLLVGRSASAVRGKHTERIAAILGSVPYPELVHRDNLVITG